jgi:S1-C subfamily serine protease
VLLLTCAHVVAFDDTVVSYHRDADGKSTPYVKNIAFKNRLVSYVSTLPEGGEVEILGIDHQTDLALIGRQFSSELPSFLPEFAYPLGEARDLEWGSFVYLFGYPSGNKMVTKGIVSSPNKGGKGGFLVDALFNRGFSGGIALAIRDGVPNFELVGLVRAVSARSSYVLAPRPEADAQEYDPTVPYSGEIYVERRTEIESGIVQAIPVDAIRTFIEANRGKLRSGGYTADRFLLRPRTPDRRPE